jgi:hypothetical protein
MIPSHNFNEQLKRFEPIEKKCSYCDEKSENSSAESAYYQALFKEQDRTNIVVYRSVKFQKVQIGIPRCAACREIHESSKSKGVLCGFGFFALSVVLGSVLFGLVGGFIGLFIGIFAGVFGAEKMEDRFVLGRGIFPRRDGAENNSVVQTFVLSGWSFTQPTA